MQNDQIISIFLAMNVIELACSVKRKRAERSFSNCEKCIVCQRRGKEGIIRKGTFQELHTLGEVLATRIAYNCEKNIL